MKRESRILEYTLILMKNLNFIILLFITSVIAYSISGIVNENESLEFLSKINILPLAPWKLIVSVLALYFSCLCAMHIKDLNITGLILKFIFEFFLIFTICYLTSFCYIGLFLLLIADLIKYLLKPKWSLTVIIGFCLIYFLTQYLIIKFNANLTPFDLYLDYFQRGPKLLITTIKELLGGANLLVFLFYAGLSIRMQYNEKERILSLNEQLNIANEELKSANIQLEEYSSELIKMTETKERNRLAREIHDTLGHTLTGIITGLEACIALIDIAPEATKVQLKSIVEVASQGMVDVRRSVKALRPDSLEKFDLNEALVHTIEEMRQATQVTIDYDFSADLKNLSNDEEDIVYRIVQESITNSIRHGRAPKIEIDVAEENNDLNISIKDNGIGCKEIHKGFGLHHMQERLKMLNGKLEYNGEDGFLLEASFPLRQKRETYD